ncbi:MAG: WYL domain-containing protein [Anaerolineae bacterium]|nr:WYL domain-containing protein [Anaerolineae bacterium]
MSCQTNLKKSAGAAKRNGISSATNFVGQTLTVGPLTRIGLAPDGQQPPLLAVREDGQYRGDVIDLEGPARVFSPIRAKDGSMWIETRAPLRLLSYTNRTGQRTEVSLLRSEREAAATRYFRAQNARNIHQAIQQKRKVKVGYQSPQGTRTFILTPLDIKGGRSEATRKNRYFWAYDEAGQRVVSLRLDRVAAAWPTAEHFDPATPAQLWAGKEPPHWNLPREWTT